MIGENSSDFLNFVSVLLCFGGEWRINRGILGYLLSLFRRRRKNCLSREEWSYSYNSTKFMRSDFCRAICTLTSWKRTGVKSLKSTPTSYIVGVHMLRTRSESQPRLPVLLVWTCPNKCQVRLFSCPPKHSSGSWFRMIGCSSTEMNIFSATCSK